MDKKYRIPVIDPLATLKSVDKNGLVKYRRPTEKQVKAMISLAQGKSHMQSLRDAGYAKGSLTDSSTKIKPLLASGMIQQLQGRLLKNGLNADYIADKYKEWLDAKREIVTKSGEVVEDNDYQTQLKAKDGWEKIMKVHETPVMPGTKGFGRKLTIEEYVYGEEDGNEEDAP